MLGVGGWYGTGSRGEEGRVEDDGYDDGWMGLNGRFGSLGFADSCILDMVIWTRSSYERLTGYGHPNGFGIEGYTYTLFRVWTEVASYSCKRR